MSFFNDEFMSAEPCLESQKIQVIRVMTRIRNDEAEWKRSKRLNQTCEELQTDGAKLEIQNLKEKIVLLTEENFELKEKLSAVEIKPTEPKIRHKIRDPKTKPCIEKTPLDLEEDKLLLELDMYLNEG